MSCYEGNTLLDRILRTGHNFVDFFNIEVVLEISKWGSGKSTITENLRNSLVNKDVPVIIFDVWKHEGDALRRTFLIELTEQLKNPPFGNNFFPKDYETNERLKGAVEEK